MWSVLTDVIPAPVLFGLAVLFGAAFLLAPEVGRRIAEREGAVAHCESGPAMAGREGGTTEIERQVTRGALDLLARATQGTALEGLSRGVAAELDRTRRAAQMSRAEQCRCLLETAVFDFGVRTDIALWLLSLRLVAGRGVTQLPEAMASVARQGNCGVGGGP